MQSLDLPWVVSHPQLPTVSTVLQMYQALRIDRPRDTSSALAKEIVVEVKVIWDRARIPTFSEHNCYRKVLDTIELWKSRHNPGELDTAFRDKLQSLMDLKPRLRGKVTDEAQLENLKSLMRQTSDTKRRMSEGKQYDWEVDYQFYLDQYKNLQFWDWPDVTRPHTFIVARALYVRTFLEEHQLTGDYGRDDYRELCELIIKYLGGQVTRARHRPDQVQDDFVMRAPGALHHARFLASCLYIMKIAMLADVLPSGLVTPAMSTNIDRMAIFISLFHGPWFLQALIPTVAPRLDLQLWQHMCLYEDVDAPIARAVKQSLLRHLWYLTEPLVVLALFDRNVEADVKSDMATWLHNTPKPQVFAPGRPRFPTQRLQRNPSLQNMVGPQSWLLFHLVHKDGDWLTLPPQQWEAVDEYRDMSLVVSDIQPGCRE